MADTLEIVPQGQLEKLDAAIAKLDQATQNVVSLAEAAQTVNFKIEGIDSLIAFVNTMKGASAPIENAATATNSMAKSVTDLNAVVEVFDDGLIDNVKNLVQQKQELTYVNTELKNLSKSMQESSGQTDQMSGRLEDLTRRQMEVKQEVSATTLAIKSQIKEQQAAIGSMDAMSQQLGQMRERYRALNAEQRNSPMGNQLATSIQRLDTQVKTLDKSIGNAQRNVGNYTDKVTVLGISADQAGKRLATMAFRIVAMQLLFMPVITLFIDLAQGIAKLIPGTDAFIEKQKSLQEVLVQTKDELTSLIDKTNEFDKVIQNALGTGEQAYQAQLDAIKALGVVKGQQFQSELNQHKATQELRTKQISDLTELANKYAKLNSIFHDVDKGGDLNRIRKDISALGLSDDDTKKFNQVLNDFLAARRKNPDLKLYGSTEVTNAQAGANVAANKVSQQQQAEDISFVAKMNELKYNKGIELEKELSGVHEQLRQANEKEDIASLDKIVNDTRAKYGLLAKDIQRNKEAYLKTVTTPENAATYTDKNIESYNRILSLLYQIGLQEQRNASFEFEKAAYNNKLSTGASLSQGAADLAKNTSGIPNYGQSVTALDAQTQAKKDALQAQFQQEASLITDSTQVIEAQRQYDAKLIKIDKDAYQERLQLANDYFTQIAQKISAATSIFSSQENTRHLNRLTSILTGGGSDAQKENRTFYENIADQKAQAHIGLQDVANKLPAAQEALGKVDLATKGPLSAEASAQAEKAKEEAQKNYNDLIELNAKYNNDIANADELAHQRKKELLNEIKDLTIQLTRETAQAVTTIGDNQFAAEQQQLDILSRKQQIQNQQAIEAINAKTEYQGDKDNELARQAAQNAAKTNEIQQQQNQLALKKAIFDKKAAEAGVLLSVAQAEAANLINFAKNPIEATVIAALIAGIGAAQYAAAASTPLPQFWTGGTTQTPVFSAAERGTELGITPQGQALIFDKPGAYMAPIGTEIKNAAETEKIIQYAIHGMNYSAPAFSTKDNNNDALALKIAEIISDKFEKVGYDLGYVIAKSKPVFPKQESMSEAARVIFNSQYSARQRK